MRFALPLVIFALAGCDSSKPTPPLDAATPVGGIVSLGELMQRSVTTDYEVLYDAGDSEQVLVRRSGDVLRWDIANRDRDTIVGSTSIADGSFEFGCFWVIARSSRRSGTSCLEGSEQTPALYGHYLLDNVDPGATYDGQRTIAGMVSFCYASEVTVAAGSVCVSSDGIVMFADLRSRLAPAAYLGALEIREAPSEAELLNAPILGAYGGFVSHRNDVPLDVALFPPVPLVADLIEP